MACEPNRMIRDGLNRATNLSTASLSTVSSTICFQLSALSSQLSFTVRHIRACMPWTLTIPTASLWSNVRLSNDARSSL